VRAAYVVDEYFDDWARNRGVQVRGPVEVLESGPEYQRAKRLHLKKFPQFQERGWDDRETVILKITPERVLSWRV
jgi:general stress protein 26